MQLFIPTLAGLFAIVYLVCVIAVIIYVLQLLGRFVSAHEKMAASMDIIAQKLKEEGKPK